MQRVIAQENNSGRLAMGFLTVKVKSFHQGAMAAGHRPVGTASGSQELLKAKHEVPPPLIGMGQGAGSCNMCDLMHLLLP